MVAGELVVHEEIWFHALHLRKIWRIHLPYIRYSKSSGIVSGLSVCLSLSSLPYSNVSSTTSSEFSDKQMTNPVSKAFWNFYSTLLLWVYVTAQCCTPAGKEKISSM